MPGDSIEKTPVEETPPAATAGETGVLATVERVIDRLEDAIKERLESDTRLRVQVTYDDTQADAPRPDGTPDGASLTAGSDAVPPAEDPQAPDSDAAAPTDIAESPESAGAATTEIATLTDGAATTEIATLTDGAATTEVATPTDGAATTEIATPTDGARATDSGTPPTSADARTTETSAAGATDTAQSPDSDTTGDATAIAAVEAGTAPDKEALVLASVPDHSIEKAPVEEIPPAEATGETGILATVERAVDRLGDAIKERIESDTRLRVQVTYDDTQGMHRSLTTRRTRRA